MCLYPKRIINKKYVINDKNGGNIPELPIIGHDTEGAPIYDERVLYVNVPCGRCIQCCQKKAHEWQIRLNEELKEGWEYMYFVTFTFSPEGLREILFKHNIQESNAAAAFALRHSLERYRKDTKKSYRHWFITELGHEGTERIHMHGIIFMHEKQEFKIIERKNNGIMADWKYWKYGHIFVGDYVNERSVNYVVKYMNKIDTDHKTFVGQILCSPGIGRRFIDHIRETGNYSYTYRPRNTRDFYRLNNGSRVKLPTYYKNKLLTDDEKELVWREFMDLDARNLAGVTYYHQEIDNATEERILGKEQEINKSLDYGDDTKEWRKQPHNITKRMLQDQARKAAFEKMAARLRVTNYELYKNIVKNDIFHE